MGGFPSWTLLGMGISAGLAVLFTALAFLAQSPSLLVRFRLAGADFSENSRRLTGLGLACTLLGMGFFMAGVPIGEQEIAQQVDQTTAAVQADSAIDASSAAQVESETGIAEIQDESGSEVASASGGFSAPAQESESDIEVEPEAESGTPDAGSSGGAFSAPAQVEDSDESESASESGDEPAEDESEAAEPTEVAVEPTSVPTNTPAPTATPSPIPTATPTPTITPTAVNVDTISVTFDGSVTWVYRVPGNSRLELVNNGDAVLLESGRAMVQGVTWQEVRLLDGRLGWIQLSLLDLGEEE